MKTNDSNESAYLKQTSEKIANRKHTLSFCKPDGVPVDLDLSDDKQFQFLLDERGGNDYLQKYFPHYHQTLHNYRGKAINAKKTNALGTPKYLTLLEKAANGDDVSTGWQDLIMIPSLIAQQTGNAAEYNIQAIALVSFVKGLQFMNATLTIGNPNTGEMIAQTNISQIFDQGYNTTVMANGITNSLDGVEASLTIDGLPYQTDQPMPPKILRLQLQDTVDPIGQIVVTNPVHKTGVNNVGFIKVCMGRWGADCDYQYDIQPSGQPPIPTVAVSGSVSYAGIITQPSADSSKFGIYFFVKKRDGGAAQLCNEMDVYKYFSLSPDFHTLSWNFLPATFEKAPWNQGDTIDLNLTVKICVDSVVKNTTFQVTSLRGVDPNNSIAIIDVLKFVWGCLSADSLIRMTDGSVKRIDSILVGQKVLTNDSGSWLTVVDVVTGKEEKPCLRITTENGRSLLVTDGHPICRHDGFCLAKELLAGDLIKTETGIEMVSSITEELYEGTVYNLKLGGNEDQTNSGATHYANGIFVGDGNMQGAILEKRKEEARKPRSIEELPAEWRFDAENAIRLSEGRALIPA